MSEQHELPAIASLRRVLLAKSPDAKDRPQTKQYFSKNYIKTEAKPESDTPRASHRVGFILVALAVCALVAVSASYPLTVKSVANEISFRHILGVSSDDGSQGDGLGYRLDDFARTIQAMAREVELAKLPRSVRVTPFGTELNPEVSRVSEPIGKHKTVPLSEPHNAQDRVGDDGMAGAPLDIPDSVNVGRRGAVQYTSPIDPTGLHLNKAAMLRQYRDSHQRLNDMIRAVGQLSQSPEHVQAWQQGFTVPDFLKRDPVRDTTNIDQPDWMRDMIRESQHNALLSQPGRGQLIVRPESQDWNPELLHKLRTNSEHEFKAISSMVEQSPFQMSQLMNKVNQVHTDARSHSDVSIDSQQLKEAIDSIYETLLATKDQFLAHCSVQELVDSIEAARDANHPLSIFDWLSKSANMNSGLHNLFILVEARMHQKGETSMEDIKLLLRQYYREAKAKFSTIEDPLLLVPLQLTEA